MRASRIRVCRSTESGLLAERLRQPPDGSAEGGDGFESAPRDMIYLVGATWVGGGRVREALLRNQMNNKIFSPRLPPRGGYPPTSSTSHVRRPCRLLTTKRSPPAMRSL